MILIEVVARQKDYSGLRLRSGRYEFGCGDCNDLRPTYLKCGNRVSMSTVIKMVGKCVMRDYESLHHAVNGEGETDIAIYNTRIVSSAEFVAHARLLRGAQSIVPRAHITTARTSLERH